MKFFPAILYRFAGTLLSDAIELMKTENITAIVAVEAKRPIGILTERDVLRTLASGEVC